MEPSSRDDMISVTDVVKAGTCPMQLYLAKSSKSPYEEPISYTVAKQLSYYLGDILSVEDIWEEGLKNMVPEDQPALSYLENMVTACSKVTWRQAERYDVSVFSEKYGIYGKVDRFFDDSFSLVKSGSAPTRGVYLSDRLRVVCYAICLEEMLGRPYYGRVEYLVSGTIRSVVVEPKDKRALFLALRAAEKVHKGGIPKVVRGPYCSWCRFQETCSAVEKPKSLFSKMMSKA
ncbi:MAG TPA: Dna2/Cas4 domain-containing protein [Methanocorpusculum sp.]|nr:Dna2/Cas4 domain-containing protein [Methanocorpusculum sp.]HJJ53776.1 Dna2/Cas4 domain-containing protein [Methanocorpusculum sp.]